MTPRSSLCRHVSFTVPAAWDGLTQQQLHYVLKLYHIYGHHPSGLAAVKTCALRYFCGFRVVRPTDAGWLCRLNDTGRNFLLNPELVPAMEEQLSWLEHPEDMTVRIEKIGDYEAASQWLQGYPFGNYLALENHYQAYLLTNDPKQLDRMLHFLYGISLTPYVSIDVEPHVLLSVFFWYTAVKKRLSQVFTHFLRPVGEGVQSGTRQTQFEMMQMQVRLLTKGDITRYQQVMDSDTWQALYELDALTRESEEFKKKQPKT